MDIYVCISGEMRECVCLCVSITNLFPHSHCPFSILFSWILTPATWFGKPILISFFVLVLRHALGGEEREEEEGLQISERPGGRDSVRQEVTSF